MLISGPVNEDGRAQRSVRGFLVRGGGRVQDVRRSQDCAHAQEGHGHGAQGIRLRRLPEQGGGGQGLRRPRTQHPFVRQEARAGVGGGGTWIKWCFEASTL